MLLNTFPIVLNFIGIFGPMFAINILLVGANRGILKMIVFSILSIFFWIVLFMFTNIMFVFFVSMSIDVMSSLFFSMLNIFSSFKFSFIDSVITLDIVFFISLLA